MVKEALFERHPLFGVMILLIIVGLFLSFWDLKILNLMMIGCVVLLIIVLFYFDKRIGKLEDK